MIYALDSSNNKIDFRYFLREDDKTIIMLHECPGIVEQYLDATAEFENLYFIVNFSWYVDDDKALVLSDFFRKVRDKFVSKFEFFDFVLILANSVDEEERLKWMLPEANIANVNNSFTLSQDSFFREAQDFSAQTRFDCIYNAKPLSFKRHYLTEKIQNKLFVSYGEERFRGDKNFLDIRRFNPKAIQWDIGDAAIRRHIHTSACGLMLSDIEGACYASTEYLLCGVPVVTTKSFGGRDEYYEEDNHLIVRATPTQVAEGVAYFVEKCKLQQIDHDAIRAKTVMKQISLRRRLCESLSQMTDIPTVTLEQYLEKSIIDGSKLWARINYWIKGIAVEN